MQKVCYFHNLEIHFTIIKPKFAVLNADDAASQEYKGITAAQGVTYGIDHEADFQATNIQMDVNGTTFDLINPFGSHQVKMKMIGKFSVYNVFASIAASVVAGVPLNHIISSLEEVKGVSGRFEAVNAGQDFSVIVDYSHTPDSLENVLKTVQSVCKKTNFCCRWMRRRSR